VTVPKVDFYLLSDTEPRARLRTACRLAEKAYDQGLRVTLRTGGAAETAEIDELLWSFSDRSFVPHCVWPADSAVAADSRSGGALLDGQCVWHRMSRLLFEVRTEVGALERVGVERDRFRTPAAHRRGNEEHGRDADRKGRQDSHQPSPSLGLVTKSVAHHPSSLVQRDGTRQLV